jgi:hypothetical protein
MCRALGHLDRRRNWAVPSKKREQLGREEKKTKNRIGKCATDTY